MKTVLKILFWFFFTLLVCIAAYWLINSLRDGFVADCMAAFGYTRGQCIVLWPRG